jgi:hypothetical protein
VAAAILQRELLTASPTLPRRRTTRGDVLMPTSPLAADLVLAYDQR